MGETVTSVTADCLHFETALLPKGWARNVRIRHAGGVIREVRAGIDAGPDCERHGIAVPGMPNLHSHAFQRGFAGLAESRTQAHDSFWTWRERMYAFVSRLGPMELEAIAAQAFVEMLESGFTHVGEFHYLHKAIHGDFDDPAEMSSAIMAAAEDTGIGLTLLPVYYAHSGFGGMAPDAAQNRFVTTPDEYARLFERCSTLAKSFHDMVVGVAPHSLRAVTEEELLAVVRLAGDVPIHIHIAEQEREVVDCLNWSGERPVAWLMARAPVDRRWCLVHATHSTGAEIAAIAKSGAVVGLCPITEANLGDGLFPLEGFVAAGGRFGIGSDSNVLISCAEELRLLEYGQRLATQRRNIVVSDDSLSVGRTLFDKVLAGGTQALATKMGLDVGCSADIIALRTGHPGLSGRTGDDILDSYIFAGTHAMIADVWRGGRKLVHDGRHFRRRAIAQRYKKILRRLL